MTWTSRAQAARAHGRRGAAPARSCECRASRTIRPAPVVEEGGIMRRLWAVVTAGLIAVLGVAASPASGARGGLWDLYREGLRGAKYIDLTHTITPRIPVWKGFGASAFSPSLNPETGQPYTYAADGFEATAYRLSTDQFGTQLDPPAH